MRLALWIFASICFWLAYAVHAAPPCVPLIPGPQKVVDWQHVSTTGREHLYWWCEDEIGKASAWGAVCVHGQDCFSDQIKTAAKAILALPDKDRWAEFARLYHLDYDCATLNDTTWQGLACAEHRTVYAANQTVWTASIKPPTWTVKKNGTYPTRPAYTLIDGVRGTKIVARSPVGVPCNIDSPYLMSKPDAWMTYDATGFVALCGRAS